MIRGNIIVVTEGVAEVEMADCATCPQAQNLGKLEEQCGAACREVDLLANICAELVKDAALVKARLDERQIQADIRFTFIKESVELAKNEMERRLEEMNQFRAQLTTQAGTFATRAELKGEAEKLDLKLIPLVKASLTREGSSRWSDYLIMALISGAIVALAKLIHL